MATHITHECKCPSCEKLQDRASNFDDSESKPIEGDFSVCNGCGDILRFDKDLKLVLASEKEIQEELDRGSQDLIRGMSRWIKQGRPK